MNATMPTWTERNADRITSLCAITGGKPEWYGTKKEIAKVERRYEVEWNGSKKLHQKASPGRLVKSKAGSWGRENGNIVSALNAIECEAEGLTPGPANV